MSREMPSRTPSFFLALNRARSTIKTIPAVMIIPWGGSGNVLKTNVSVSPYHTCGLDAYVAFEQRIVEQVFHYECILLLPSGKSLSHSPYFSGPSKRTTTRKNDSSQRCMFNGEERKTMNRDQENLQHKTVERSASLIFKEI